MHQIWHFKALNQYSIAHKIQFRLLKDFKTNYSKLKYKEKLSEEFPSFSQKNGFVFVNQFWHFKALNQYSVAQKIQFRLLKDFKTNL